MGEVLANAELKERVYPTSGAHYMSALRKPLQTDQPGGETWPRIWNGIFTRYGYEAPYPEAGFNAESPTQATGVLPAEAPAGLFHSQAWASVISKLKMASIGDIHLGHPNTKCY